MERMLASAALVVGPDDDLRWDRKGNRSRRRRRLSIWRCDPTGQFWDCHAAAVGRGAGGAEGEIMAHVAAAKMGKNLGDEEKENVEEMIAMISPQDVRDYLSGMSFEDAVILACQCIKRSLRLEKLTGKDIVHRMGIQGVLLHASSSEGVIRRELVDLTVLHEAFDRCSGAGRDLLNHHYL